jgi:hypothetical protein
MGLIGFARMSPEERRVAGKKGGRNADGRHKWTSEKARQARLKGTGRKGTGRPNPAAD